ncbi:MAG TPA: hypothetical protein VM866_10025 [Pyrinomonadaceae bacterium]|nr:hypothetical protein [Pyrinomonadaceae bacterium]
MTEETLTLYRPVGQKEYNLIRQSNNAIFPPRLHEQPFFYPFSTKNTQRKSRETGMLNTTTRSGATFYALW